MHVRTLLIAAASLSALSPAISIAGPEMAALKACTAAFASSLAAKGDATPAVKLNYRSIAPSSSLAEYFAREYTFYLKANDPKTGSSLANATCSATTTGVLLSLSATPLKAEFPTLAAQL